MATTELSLTATPGKPHVFLAKAAAVVVGAFIVEAISVHVEAPVAMECNVEAPVAFGCRVEAPLAFEARPI